MNDFIHWLQDALQVVQSVHANLLYVLQKRQICAPFLFFLWRYNLLYLSQLLCTVTIVKGWKAGHETHLFCESCTTSINLHFSLSSPHSHSHRLCYYISFCSFQTVLPYLFCSSELTAKLGSVQCKSFVVIIIAPQRERKRESTCFTAECIRKWVNDIFVFRWPPVDHQPPACHSLHSSGRSPQDWEVYRHGWGHV